MMAPESPAPCPTTTTKKRTAESEDSSEEPCAKKPKLSKKELLEAAKARLKEAQEKKKLVQQKLEEEQKKETTIQEQAQPYEDYGCYTEDYYYEYHIPPVTGPYDNLLIHDIASTGPAEKVHFIEDKRSCIEEVLRVISGRKRTHSPVNAASPWAANPQAGPPPAVVPPKQPSESLIKSTTTTNRSSDIERHKLPARPLSNTRHGSNSGDYVGPPSHQSMHPPPRDHPNVRDRDRDRDLRDRDRDMRERDRDIQMKDKPRRDSLNEKSQPRRDSATGPPQRRDSATGPPQRRESATGPPPRRESATGPPQRRDSASGPPTRRDSVTGPPQRRDSAGPPQKPFTRPWKLALAQITSKTLDCTMDLPTKTPYMIRTQSQGVVAYVQFFSVPENPALLQHNPSKRHLQDHLTPLQRLPCNTSQAWKAQDILLFLQHQDERRTTYQPPARRNLPLSHWALIDLEQPLHQTNDSLGYFTAAPNNAKTKISFAGKLVWNMNDFYHNQDSGMRQRTAFKLSKWGEMVSAKATTTGNRNAPLIATVQGFYEIPASNSNQPPPSMPPKLRARKVILPKSRTIGFIIGANPKLSEAAMEQQQQLQQNGNNNNNNNNNAAPAPTIGCVQVLFPNGMASGPSSIQSLKGARAILYD